MGMRKIIVGEKSRTRDVGRFDGCSEDSTMEERGSVAQCPRHAVLRGMRGDI